MRRAVFAAVLLAVGCGDKLAEVSDGGNTARDGAANDGDASGDGPATSMPPLCDPTDPTLEVCYDFDEGAGNTIHDGSGHGYDLRNEDLQHGGLAWIQGPRGWAVAGAGGVAGAVQADAASYTDTPKPPPALSRDMTFELWVGGGDLDPSAPSFFAGPWGDNADGYGIKSDRDPMLVVGGTQNRLDIVPAESHRGNQWAHFAFAYHLESGAGSSCNSFINGVLQETADRGSCHFTGQNPIAAGGVLALEMLRPAQGSYFRIALGGPHGADSPASAVDMIRIYSRRLSDAEICAHAGRTSCAAAP